MPPTLVAALLGVTGCAGPLRHTAAPHAGAPACVQVASRWPSTVGGMARREVEPPEVAAWGAPEVVARCGAVPAGRDAADCLGVDTVDWVEQPLDGGRRFVTYGRDPAVEVLVPDAHAPGGLLLGAFTHAVAPLPAAGARCR